MSEEVEIKDPKAVLAALERAKNDAKRYREEADGLRQELADMSQKHEALQASLKQYEEGESVWQDRAKKALVAKAVSGPNAERILKFIDMDSITFDEEGNLAGVDEAVSKVKADLPELFDPKKRVGGAADLFAEGDSAKPVSGTEAQVARLFRRGA